MLFDDEVIGVIVLAKLGLNQFGPDDLRVLEIYASIAAQAMANADATERLRAQSEALGAPAQQPARAVARDRIDPHDARHAGTPRGDRRAPRRHCSTVDNIRRRVHDATTHRLRPIFARGVHAEQFLATAIPRRRGHQWRGHPHRRGAARPGRAARRSRLHFGRSARQAGALIVAPLRSGEGIQGVLTIERLGAEAHFQRTRSSSWSSSSRRTSRSRCATPRHTARSSSRAETDPLTGLWNHGALTAADRPARRAGRASRC